MDEVAVFTSDQVQRLTGISRRQLGYWLAQGVVAASIDHPKGRGRVRLYSFANLVEIRVALWLRDKVSLQLIRKIGTHLRKTGAFEQPLAELSFGVIEDVSGRAHPRHDVVVKGADGVWERWESGQKVMEIAVPLRRFADELEKAADADRRARRRAGGIERRRGVLGSARVVAGTRVPTSAIWALHRAGYDTERILRSYPGLASADVRAALAVEQRRRLDRRERSG